MDKQEYEAPALSVIGSIAEVTQGNSTGNFTDDDFPQNTPFNQLTFSG